MQTSTFCPHLCSDVINALSTSTDRQDLTKSCDAVQSRKGQQEQRRRNYLLQPDEGQGDKKHRGEAEGRGQDGAQELDRQPAGDQPRRGPEGARLVELVAGLADGQEDGRRPQPRLAGLPGPPSGLC